MKKYIAIFLTVLISACADTEDIQNAPSTDDGVESGALCTVAPLEYISDDEASRSTLTYSSTQGMIFNWQYGEVITVFSDDKNSGNFTLEGEGGEPSALFTGGGFHLIKDKRYYSLSKSNQDCMDKNNATWHNAPEGLNTSVMTNIFASYNGQRQIKNTTPSNVAHLGPYDYMVATATASDENVAHFHFLHLGMTLRLVIKGLPAGKRFTKLTMYDASDDGFRGFDKTVNLMKGLSADGYKPAWENINLTDQHERFSILLGQQDDKGVEQGLSVSEGKSLFVYMELPPYDFSGKTMAFRLTPKEGETDAEGNAMKPYFCLADGVPLRAGTARQITMTAEKCTQYTFNIKLVQDWIKGNTESQSRAAGDPGAATSDCLPKYLYVFFINNGKLVQHAKTEVSDVEGTDWVTKDGISTLRESVEWTVNDGTKKNKLTLDNQYTNNPKVYVVASPTEITSWKDRNGQSVTLNAGTENGTDETVIQSLAYNYDTSAMQDVAQSTIKCIYSTPWSSTNFVGSIKPDDDIKDIRIYHVAAKVDVNWESESALAGNISINNFPTTNLSYFMPTTANTTSGATSVTTAITTGTAYNGRAVFYLPQPSSATYNVTIGSTTEGFDDAKKTEDITFSRDDVFTSWFRGLITIQ